MLKKAIIIFIVALFALPALGKPNLEVGSACPLLDLPNLAGKTISLEKYLGKKPIILCFFASWSKSCQEELASLQGLSEKYAKKGLEVIGISYDRKLKSLKKFASENKIDFTILHDKKLKSIKDFRVLIIPTLVVIDKSGEIKSIYVDFDKNVRVALDKEIKKL